MSGVGRPPSGASRLTTGRGGGGMASSMGRPPVTGMAPMSARPGTRGGAGYAAGALNSMVQVSDRPVTRQGLGGLKTQVNCVSSRTLTLIPMYSIDMNFKNSQGQGPQRIVQYKSY